MSNTTIVGEDGASGTSQNAIIIVMDDATGQTQEIDAATMHHLISSNPGAVNIVSIDQDSLQPTGAAATVTAPVESLPAAESDLILDSEALDRLESALSSDEAREIFGDGLQIGGMGVNITGEEFPDELISIETDDGPDQSGDRVRGGRTRGRSKKRASGTRRSQRAADQSLRDLAEQIRAENLTGNGSSSSRPPGVVVADGGAAAVVALVVAFR